MKAIDSEISHLLSYLACKSMDSIGQKIKNKRTWNIFFIMAPQNVMA